MLAQREKLGPGFEIFCGTDAHAACRLRKSDDKSLDIAKLIHLYRRSQSIVVVYNSRITLEEKGRGKDLSANGMESAAKCHRYLPNSND